MDIASKQEFLRIRQAALAQNQTAHRSKVGCLAQWSLRKEEKGKT